MYRLSDGSPVRDLPHHISKLDRKGRLAYHGPNNSKPTIYDVETGEELWIRTLQRASIHGPSFRLDSKFVAWGNSNGTVSVCDIDRCREEFAAGLKPPDD